MKLSVSMAKVLAMLSPAIATLAATVATWLTTHVHLFATFHVGTSGIASAISQAVVFGVTAIGTYLIQHKVLGGVIELNKIERQAQLAQPAPFKAPSDQR